MTGKELEKRLSRIPLWALSTAQLVIMLHERDDLRGRGRHEKTLKFCQLVAKQGKKNWPKDYAAEESLIDKLILEAYGPVK